MRILCPMDLLHPHADFAPFLKTTNAKVPIYAVSADTETEEYVYSWFQSATENLNTFWNVWQIEYLQALVEKHHQAKIRKFGSKTWPMEGHVVLLKQESTPRTESPLAILLKINISKDGTICSAKIRTSNKLEIERAMNHLIPLEIQAGCNPKSYKKLAETNKTVK